MRPARFQRVVRGQLDQLLREGLLDEARHRELASRYPVERWDWRSLGRWFLIFGALSAASGVVWLGEELFELTLRDLAVALALVTAALFGAGWKLRTYPWTSRSLELCGGLSLIALTFTVGHLVSSGSGNWPALLLIDLLILLPTGYLLRNVLLLTLSAAVFFSWFGGVTGYASGWGVYWFGMSYPLRFLLAGIGIALVGLLHRRAEHAWLARFPGFFYVWLASGVFFAEMALWLMSLFGSFGEIDAYAGPASPLELVCFNALWAGSNLLLLWLGARYALRMLRGFAVTYLIIHGYTLFFWHVASHLGGVLSTAIAGGAALALVAALERRRRSTGPEQSAFA